MRRFQRLLGRNSVSSTGGNTFTVTHGPGGSEFRERPKSSQDQMATVTAKAACPPEEAVLSAAIH